MCVCKGCKKIEGGERMNLKTWAGEPEPGVFGSLEPEPAEKKTRTRSRSRKKNAAPVPAPRR